MKSPLEGHEMARAPEAVHGSSGGSGLSRNNHSRPLDFQEFDSAGDQAVRWLGFHGFSLQRSLSAQVSSWRSKRKSEAQGASAKNQKEDADMTCGAST